MSAPMTYSFLNDGTRKLVQPPFEPGGMVVSNHTDRIAIINDGRAGHWEVRAGATARYQITTPDSNYIINLAAPTTVGACTITLTPFTIEETGEPAAQGARVVAQTDEYVSGNPGGQAAIITEGATRVDIHIQIRDAHVAPNTVKIQGLDTIPPAIVGAVSDILEGYYDLVPGGEINIDRPLVLTIGENEPLPEQIIVLVRLPQCGYVVRVRMVARA